MASVEMIGLLCAGSTRYHDVGGGSGSSDRLTRAELAGLLAGIGEAGMNLAQAKYACDLDAERKLVAHVRVWSSGVGVKEGWQVVRGRPTILNMSALAVFEVVRPNRCVRCSGRGFTASKLCACCGGSGFKNLSGRKIAEAMGVDECNYRRLWKSRYESCLKYVQGLDSEVIVSVGQSDRDCFYAAVN